MEMKKKKKPHSMRSSVNWYSKEKTYVTSFVVGLFLTFKKKLLGI